jgi:hypothetical protein
MTMTMIMADALFNRALDPCVVCNRVHVSFDEMYALGFDELNTVWCGMDGSLTLPKLWVMHTLSRLPATDDIDYMLDSLFSYSMDIEDGESIEYKQVVMAYQRLIAEKIRLELERQAEELAAKQAKYPFGDLAYYCRVFQPWLDAQ